MVLGKTQVSGDFACRFAAACAERMAGLTFRPYQREANAPIYTLMKAARQFDRG